MHLSKGIGPTRIDKNQLPIIQPLPAVTSAITPPSLSENDSLTQSLNPHGNIASDQDSPSTASYSGATWLLQPVVFNQMNGVLQFRVAVRTGRSGRTMAWTLPFTSRPPEIPPMTDGEVLLRIISSKKTSVEVRKATDILTLHLTKSDIHCRVWLIHPQLDIRSGILRSFDIYNSLTTADETKYGKGNMEAMVKFNSVICRVATLSGGLILVRNDNLVRYNIMKL